MAWDAATEQSGTAVPAESESLESLRQRSLVCTKAQKYRESLALGQRMLALAPGNDAGTQIVGLSWLRLGELAQALPYLEQAVVAMPNNGLVHWQLAQTLQGLDQHARALLHFDRAQTLDVGDQQMEHQRYLSASKLLKHSCDWVQYDRAQRLARQSVMVSGRWVVGESTLASTYFSNAVLLRSAQNHARQVLATVGLITPFSFQAPGRRIRLGFVGCDFYEQATAYLMTGFIEALNRDDFELVAYEHGPQRPETAFRRRVRSAYDRFLRIDELSDEQAARRIHEDGIDVIFSIKNPVHARLGIFARRPAALQVHYLYYPATSGMPFFDYIVADAVTIPAGLESAYCERVLRLPGCYQPNDHCRVKAVDTPRSRWGLPESAIVLANFGQSYKYTPDMFDLWCLLLGQDASRILWLMCPEPEVQARLRRETRARGVAPTRLYFTDVLSTQEHLNRLRHADLVLDTFPCGGHTVTSDALWAGTPVLTRCGETFASRVAASLLIDVGMGELVANDEQQYLDKADALLSNSQRRKQWRQHLDQGRASFPLFDAVAYARKFEQVISDAVATHWGAGGMASAAAVAADKDS